jgi:hypothetical protein
VEFRNAEDKLHYAIIGVTEIIKLEDSILIKTENDAMSRELDENPVKAKGLKLQLYYATPEDIRNLMGNKGMFAHGIQVIDGRLEGAE